jgi:hypothetical protein
VVVVEEGAVVEGAAAPVSLSASGEQAIAAMQKTTDIRALMTRRYLISPTLPLD